MQKSFPRPFDIQRWHHTLQYAPVMTGEEMVDEDVVALGGLDDRGCENQMFDKYLRGDLNNIPFWLPYWVGRLCFARQSR